MIRGGGTRATTDSPVNPGGLGFDEWVIGLNFFDLDPYLSRNGVVEHHKGKAGTTNPLLFPALRSGPTTASGASRQKHDIWPPRSRIV